MSKFGAARKVGRGWRFATRRAGVVAGRKGVRAAVNLSAMCEIQLKCTWLKAKCKSSEMCGLWGNPPRWSHLGWWWPAEEPSAAVWLNLLLD